MGQFIPKLRLEAIRVMAEQSVYPEKDIILDLLGYIEYLEAMIATQEDNSTRADGFPKTSNKGWPFERDN